MMDWHKEHGREKRNVTCREWNYKYEPISILSSSDVKNHSTEIMVFKVIPFSIISEKALVLLLESIPTLK